MIKIKEIKLSPSSIALYKACPQKFIYSTLKERTEREINPEEPSAAEWGTLFHKLLENQHNGAEFVSSGNKDVDGRFREYLRQYPQDLTGSFASEQTLERRLNDRVVLIGTPDMIDKENRILIDHKTQSSISDKDHVKYKMRDQFIHYGWLAGFDIGFSVIVNQISRAANPKIKFNRLMFEVSEQVISDWLSRVTKISEDIISDIENQNAWLRKSGGDACGDYNGCYFLDACRLGLYAPEGGYQNLTNKHFSITFEDRTEETK